MFNKKRLEDCLQNFEKRNNKLKNLKKVPILDKEYLNFLQNYKTIEINCDLELLEYEQVLKENQYIEKNYKDISKSLWLIAFSGQGDEWFLRKKDETIIFYDHNYGEYAKEGLNEMKINYSEFIEMGFVIRELENYLETNKITDSSKSQFISLLNSISNNLYQRYPYKYW